jgi:hypothetical protein
VLRILTLRNIVCPIAIPAGAFPAADFAETLDLGEVEQQIQVPNFAIWEFSDLRLQILPDRIQLGFRQGASHDLVRSAVEEFIRIARSDFKTNTFGFNANLKLDLEPTEPDPTALILNSNELVERLGGSEARGGVWLVYQDDDSSRWWVELVPQIDADRSWTFSINRHYAEFPTDEETEEAVLAWFADAEMSLGKQCELLMGVTDGN